MAYTGSDSDGGIGYVTDIDEETDTLAAHVRARLRSVWTRLRSAVGRRGR